MTGDTMTADEQLQPAGHGLLKRGVMRPVESRTVAALYVEPKGCYVGVPGVDPWDEAKDARKYSGPHPVVAHPPCQRWGRFWHGSTRKPHQFKLGDDGGCFAAALHAVLTWGGVLEHPAHSKAWDAFGLRKPAAGAGWQEAGFMEPWFKRYWVCYVEQGHYGHDSRKPTWLIAAHVHRNDLPPPGTEIGHVTLSLYGQSVHVPIRQPGTVNGRRPRSDQIAVEVDGAWLVMSLREAALDAVKRMPRVMTRKERGVL